MFINRVVEAMEKLAGLTTEFMLKVVALANGEYNYHNFSDFLGAYIDGSAKELALAICQPEKVRFVVNEVFLGEKGTMCFIRSGLPGNVGSHGFGLEEPLYEPRKEALVEAHEHGKVVIIEDAKRDPRTEYMRAMTWDPKYNIDQIAVIPMNLADLRIPVSFLVAIDIVNSPHELAEEQVQFLEKARALVVNTVRSAVELLHRVKVDRAKDKRDLLLNLHHEIRNPLTSLGGFAKRVASAATDDRVRRYADIMIEESARIEKAVNGLKACTEIDAPDEPLCVSWGEARIMH